MGLADAACTMARALTPDPSMVASAPLYMHAANMLRARIRCVLCRQTPLHGPRCRSALTTGTDQVVAVNFTAPFYVCSIVLDVRTGRCHSGMQLHVRVRARVRVVCVCVCVCVLPCVACKGEGVRLRAYENVGSACLHSTNRPCLRPSLP